MSKREKISADTVLTDEMEIKLGDVWMVHRGAIGCKVSGFYDKTSVRYKDDPSSEFTYKPEQEKHPTCSNCGRTLIHVRPGKWQCECELESIDQEEVCDMCREHYDMPKSWDCKGVRCNDALEICLKDNRHVTEETELKIEIGKYYRTLGNHKVLCKYVDGRNGEFHNLMEGDDGSTYMVTKEGKTLRASEYAITSEWTDTPEPAPWQDWPIDWHDGERYATIDMGAKYSDLYRVHGLSDFMGYVYDRGVLSAMPLMYANFIGELFPTKTQLHTKAVRPVAVRMGTLKEGGE